MAALTAAAVSRDGIAPAPVAADAAGDEFTNTGKEFLYVENTGVGAVTITITTHQTVDGLAVPDRTVNVPAGEVRLIGPFPGATYNRGTTERVVDVISDTPADTLIRVLSLTATS